MGRHSGHERHSQWPSVGSLKRLTPKQPKYQAVDSEGNDALGLAVGVYEGDDIEELMDHLVANGADVGESLTARRASFTSQSKARNRRGRCGFLRERGLEADVLLFVKLFVELNKAHLVLEVRLSYNRLFYEAKSNWSGARVDRL